MVTKEHAERLGEELRAAAVKECSAMTQDGLKDVFDSCIRIGLDHRTKRY